MVEIWRWPNASYSVSATACIDTPSRIAASRSTTTWVRNPSFCWSVATFSSSGRSARRWRNFGAQTASSAGSVSTSVYWNCVRLTRVPICTSCTGWKNAVMPGMPAIACCSRAITTAAESRWRTGFSAIDSRPVLGVALIVPAPTNETTPVTAGSRRTISATCVCSVARRGIDTLCPASVTAMISPVSCCGRNPLGTIMYRPMVPTSVLAATSSISRWRPNVQSRLRR